MKGGVEVVLVGVLLCASTKLGVIGISASGGGGGFGGGGGWSKGRIEELLDVALTKQAKLVTEGGGGGAFAG